MNEMRELDDSLKGLIVGIGVNRNCRFVNAESRDTLLSESVLQPGFLYIYLNQVQCDACVRQELALLRGSAVKDRFRVISSGAAIRSVRIFLSSNQITPDKAYVIIDSLGSIMERLTMPTMFQVDSEMRVKSEVHFGRVGFEAVTQRYLNGVKL